MKTFGAVLMVLAVAAGLAWYRAGNATGPLIEIERPTRLVGQTGQLDLRIETPGPA